MIKDTSFRKDCEFMVDFRNIFDGAGKKKLIVFSVALATTCAAFSVAKGNDESLDTLSSDSSLSTAEQKLTSEEIDKIIEDLKVSGNVDNIIDKLNEYLIRARLAENDALVDYLEKKIEYYTSLKQTETLKGEIEALKKKNSNVSDVDEQVSKIMSSDMILSDLEGALSSEAMSIIYSLGEDNIKKLQDLLVEVEGMMNIKDTDSLAVQQRSLLDVLFLSKAIEDSLVSDERLEEAENTLSVAVTILESYEKQKYGTSEYDNLVEGSDNFSKTGNKSSSILPEQIIFFNGYFNIKHEPIMYDGHILLALDDLFQYIDSDIEYMYNNPTMVIKSPNKILELVCGKSTAYVEDKPQSMPVPVLSFNNVQYMPVESFAEAYDISYKFLPDSDCIILYDNLVQLENSSVPNQLNKG